MSEDNKKVMKSLAESTDSFICGELNANLKDIKTRKDLERYVFHCLGCGKTKPATEMVRVETPLVINRKDEKVTVTQKIMVLCNECSSLVRRHEG